AQHRDAGPAGHHRPPPEVEAQVQGSVKPAGQVGGGLPRLDVRSNRIWLGRAGEAWEGAHLDGLQRWMMPPDRLAPGTEPGREACRWESRAQRADGWRGQDQVAQVVGPNEEDAPGLGRERTWRLEARRCAKQPQPGVAAAAHRSSARWQAANTSSTLTMPMQ